MTVLAADPDDRLDMIFQALANKTRRALIERLKKGPAMVTELARPFGMSLNAISKHLFVLEKAGLINRTIAGRVHSCALEAGPMARADIWLRSYEDFWGGQLDRFSEFVESGQDLEKRK